MSDDPPDPSPPGARAHATLALCTLLHMFTHAYGNMLVPLYLLIVADLRLGGVRAASLVVTVYGLVYFLGSYAAGVMADRFDRKLLLGVGLLGNAAAITLMAMTHGYAILLALGVMAGVFGTLFHPAANALVPAHYPRSPGMAIGLLGVGSGLGFYLGPKFAGWRAGAATYGHFAAWQRPCLELGLAGLVSGIVFLFVARETRRGPAAARSRPRPLSPMLRNRVLLIATLLGCRDFAGVAMLSLTSIYLQKARGLGVAQAGTIIGLIFLPCVVFNPIAVWLTPGRRRLPALVGVLLAGGLVLLAVPHLSLVGGILAIGAFQSMQMISYALSDAGMLERVPAAARGRVVGLFLLIAGTFAATGPWAMGLWTDLLGPRAADPLAYAGPFSTIAAMIALASLAAPVIARLGPETAPAIEPFTETMPATVEAVG